MLLLSLVYSSISAQWAVLMAGSRGYNNYRHQADVFNLYSILANRGFQKDHIITLAYNDIVDHELNPRKGEVYSRSDHDNVYPGSNAIDYQEKEATAENFLRVLNGDTKNGRALQSEEGDDVFIYYNDHGAPGLFYAFHQIMDLNYMLIIYKKQSKKCQRIINLGDFSLLLKHVILDQLLRIYQFQMFYFWLLLDQHNHHIQLIGIVMLMHSELMNLPNTL
ncbi:hypothetical protein TRFO_33578 [Tritrichomonas foetus]|uniref:Peptidase C13 family protein n=1 Tax=Tritrichomonas foetus TaxID=1144522 RepID=A0A1J4JQP0_9EUKA|nr:hypothetical protein TRFO_33578 [Tritrichomonas foetus]|eukprot:OHS99837.1 hypothetical protein TRFO_33578 [Tritrichomonas foetus]